MVITFKYSLNFLLQFMYSLISPYEMNPDYMDIFVAS
jgi:hypothetical protein